MSLDYTDEEAAQSYAAAGRKAETENFVLLLTELDGQPVVEPTPIYDAVVLAMPRLMRGRGRIGRHLRIRRVA